ncbi:unnamed protein product [Rotaria socialis]|uniref:Carrier domain-containing protein n=1 Tax=Rotaria socialis TaxID=392032 RepID=A0A821GKH2_9BILA|nr:unnamed protein product [Rotaria socialis]
MNLVMNKRASKRPTSTVGSVVPSRKELTIQSSGKTQYIASLPQQRIWLHERLHFSNSELSVYNIVLPIIVKRGSLAIEYIRSRLLRIIEENTVLRTAVRFNLERNQIEQYIEPLSDNLYSFENSRGIATSEQIDHILTRESVGKYFDLEKGRVLRCHIIQRSEDKQDQFLHKGDLVAITFHHIAFDNSSLKPFIKAFERVCKTDYHQQSVSPMPQYIDFTLYEQAMLNDPSADSKMNKARRFWLETMRGYDWNKRRSLMPEEDKVDRIQSGKGYATAFDFDQNIVDAMMLYASSNNVTMFSLTLACYYVFLFKLTNSEEDLCVASVTANRPLQEMADMIGMFVNILPYRIKVEPHKSFYDLLEKVQKLSSDVLEHGSLPYQEIMNLDRKQEYHALPSALFQYESLVSSLTQKSSIEVAVGKNSSLGVYFDRDRSHGNGVAAFDLTLTISHNHHAKTTECFIDCSADVFKNQTNVEMVGNRFRHMLFELFCSPMTHEPIYKLSIIIPSEQEVMHQLNNTKSLVSYPWSFAIHERFARQAQLYPQKIVLELDQQSLTYSELLHYVRRLTIHLSQRVQKDEIVCQCVERSIEMVIGLLAILSSGVAYCPLAPADPPTRLATLVRDTRAKTILVHSYTSGTLVVADTSCDLIKTDSFLISDEEEKDGDDDLKPILVTPNKTAYIIFTSGTTGTPKAVVISHSSLIYYLQSSVEIDALRTSDKGVQLSSCTWDVHIHEILGTLFVGGSIVLLRSEQGNRNMDYLARVIESHQVTFVCIVPTLQILLFDILEVQQAFHRLNTLRLVWSVGEPIPSYLVARILPLLPASCKYVNFGGATEGTVVQTFHTVTENDAHSLSGSVPLGRPMPYFKLHILDKFHQSVPVGYTGELYTSGAIMSGYLNRPDLNAKVLIQLTDESGKSYKTGDLARFLPLSGEVQLLGREDSQTKFNGQRVELGEIEAVMYRSSAAICNCAVIKMTENGRDHLVAYIQPSTTDTAVLFDAKQVRAFCEKNLSQWMVPSHFIVVHQLPINSNGKLDRAALLKPDLSPLPEYVDNSDEYREDEPPMTVEQNRVHNIWCHILKIGDKKKIPINSSFFSMGGNSLTMMRLYSEYQKSFQCNSQCPSFNIACLFRQSTIAQHALILQQWFHDASQNEDVQQNQKQNEVWRTLNILEAEASHAQQRIFLDQLVRFSDDTALYNVPLIYRVQSDNNIGGISFDRLRRAINSVIVKHVILRTSLHLDNITGLLTQRIEKFDDLKEQYKFCVSRFENGEQMTAILNHEIKSPELFDLSRGIVLRCHVVIAACNKSFINETERNTLQLGDILVFNLHHIAFDGASRRIFFRDLKCAFENDVPLPLDENSLQYIDYSVLEGKLDMIPSRDFWRSQLVGFDFERRLSLPFDRYHSLTENRSGLAHLVEFHFDEDLSNAFLEYASDHGVTPFQLGLATFYVFLFKLSNNESDLCTSCIHANRYRAELADLIGMFVATLPHRIQLDPNVSFDELVKRVGSQFFSIIEHTYYPLQRILADSDHKQSSAGFLQILFDFITYSNEVDLVSISNTQFESVSLERMENVVKFDLKLLFFYDPAGGKTISCSLICSRDVFDLTTVENLATQFHHILFQLFAGRKTATSFNDQVREPISQLSLILPEKSQVLQRTTFHHLSNIDKQAPASYAQCRIWRKEQMCHGSNQIQMAVNNMPFVYRLSSGGILPLYLFRRALQLIVIKHESLRTALVFDTNEKILMQQIIDVSDDQEQLFAITESIFQTEEEYNHILNDERNNVNHFDLVQGRVFRCHVVYHNKITHDGHITNQDTIIFNFHRAVFDLFSINLFQREFEQAYVTGELISNDSTTVRYIDYAVSERQMSMNAASQFWIDALQDCEIDRQLSLPFDHRRISTDKRTKQIASASFEFGDHLSHDFLAYAREKEITPKHLGLALNFLFLFGLTNGERDLCIGMETDVRYKSELKSIIGTFVNRIPLRCRFDPNWSFVQLVEYVHEIATVSAEYSYYPLERILAQYSQGLQAAFLDISFEFDSLMSESESNQIVVDDLRITMLPYGAATNTGRLPNDIDFTLKIQHDRITNKLSCSTDGSLDLFDTVTITKISQRFHLLIQQLFQSQINYSNKPLYELSLILPDEHLLIKSLSNNQICSSPDWCVHHQISHCASNHPQKVAVELDEQSLTYSELLYYSQWLALKLLTEFHVKPGDVICQCVERSLSMVIGILSIVTTGGAYCPLSSLDPTQRRQTLVNQTHSHLVLVHSNTHANVGVNVSTLDIDAAINSDEVFAGIKLNSLLNVSVTPENIAFVIFTSGSTGVPKAAQLRHRNFTEFICSFVHAGIISKLDTIIQMARCTFDNHLLSLVGTLVAGGTLVMLRPEGNMDFEYLAGVLDKKQVTVMHSVPSLLRGIFTFLKENNLKSSAKWLRCLCSGGETLSFKTASLMKSQVKETCWVRNQYGPAELTINCASNLIRLSEDQSNIPIGRLLPNFYCLILDEYLQPICIGHEGELLVGGVGVFAGYFGREDLTSRALINIDGKMVYRTGDLARIDRHGLIHYISRKDHQVKLHGQRIELGEIERCLLGTAIAACVVTKWGDDHLIAYVQSSKVSAKQLREHCQSHLPPFMVPSLFIVLEKFPLNVNGKVDRKCLPPPDFTLLLSSASITSEQDHNNPSNEYELSIHSLWCELLHRPSISKVESIFSIGGHSLLLIQLYQRYKTIFGFNTHILNIAKFFQYPTIVEHARLISKSIDKDNDSEMSWHSLHLVEAPLSFAQERIMFDEHLRFSTKRNTMYTILMAYRIQNVGSTISIARFHRALKAMLIKHKVLRTVISSDMTGTFKQSVIDMTDYHDDHRIYGVTTLNMSDDENIKSLYDRIDHSEMFDLAKGRVLHCYILRNHRNLSLNTDLLTDGDAFILAVHHSIFDGFSTPNFLIDLCLAYETDAPSPIDNDTLQYIDYSVHERLISMEKLRDFWHLQLNGYDLARPLPLPFDRHRAAGDERSGLSCIAEFSFGEDLSRAFLDYASSRHVTSFQLGLASFYAFLFKLCNNESDLCVAGISANRYRLELRDLIGMFVTTLPYRIQINSNGSFDKLVEQVSNCCLSVLEHSQYPLQHIIVDSHNQKSSAAFLETVFDYITIAPKINQLSLGKTQIQRMVALQADTVAKFDFLCTFVENPSATDNIMSCSFVCSQDLFDQTKVETIARRFQQLLTQIFSSKSMFDRTVEPIYNLSVILPEELEEMQRMVFHRVLNVTHEAPASYAQARIWLDERIRFDSEKSKVAIYNLPFLHRVASGDTLSITKLRKALQLVVMKHVILRTSLYFDTDKNILMQRIMDPNDSEEFFSFIESTFETDEDLNTIMHNERGNPHNFNLSNGLVCRCHVVYHKSISKKRILCAKDALIFNFHHASFDFPSMAVFRRDLDQAYTTGHLTSDDDTNLRYLDYAITEQQMSMVAASAFWRDVLHDCELDRPLPLPFDRLRVSDESRTGRGASVTFQFGQNLSQAFITYASTHDLKLEHLALAVYYIFLFKLTNGETDICLVMNTHGRYKPELMAVIGMFVNAIPMRCRFDPNYSFSQFVQHVQTVMMNNLEHSYFPLQHILAQHPLVSRPAFLDTFFGFVSFPDVNSRSTVSIGGVKIVTMPYSIRVSTHEIASKYDFSLNIHHDSATNDLSYAIEASLDLFTASTVNTIGKRFHAMLEQLFESNMTHRVPQSIYGLSIILPDDTTLIESIKNTQLVFPPPQCMHHNFMHRVIEDPQKLAVELDGQSLTYSELLFYTQRLALHLLTRSNFRSGDIVCQCMERSISMVMGILSILMAGGLYCPLSPRDSGQHLESLISQTHSSLILVDLLTKDKFKHNDKALSIDLAINNNEHINEHHLDQLSNVKVTPESVAYVIFTSGSTGTPKAAQVRHKNFTGCIRSLVHIGVFDKADTIVQMARCSFDIHMQDIMGTLVVGASLVMLRPRGNMDFEYLAAVIKNKKITLMHAVPSLLSSFSNFLEERNCRSVMDTVHTLCSSGEALTVRVARMLNSTMPSTCKIWDLYGPAECTLISTYHCVDTTLDIVNIPIGRPLPNYQCLIIDDFSQLVYAGQNGELLVGGVGVFDSYLNRDDLTAKALVIIDENIFYRTGDLVRINSHGLIDYLGRKDHQVKVRGQRIELSEIEHCLLDTSISACVVIKWSDEHLIAYVQGYNIDQEKLREHCRSHLASFMVPSMFIALEQFPLNANGKLHRQRLPKPNFSSLTKVTEEALIVPCSPIEERVLSVWCEILHCDHGKISTASNFFSIGGHSLLFIQLYHRYQSLFCFSNELLPITMFLNQTTISEHAKLLESVKNIDKDGTIWQSLHLIDGIASFAQERIYLDEQVRFNDGVSVYNELTALRLKSGSLSKARLQRAIRSVLKRHQVLRTRLILDTDQGTLTQYVTCNHSMFKFDIVNTFKSDTELDSILFQVKNNPNLFDLSNGHVFHCQVVCQNSNDRFTYDDLIGESDVLVFAFHHAAFDRTSRQIFFNDLNSVYEEDKPFPDNEDAFQYIDYAVHERHMDMTSANKFWHSQLDGFNTERQLAFSMDRYRLTNDDRSGFTVINQFPLDDQLSQSFINYASVHEVTPFQLGLALFYAFTFKLANGLADLCVACTSANRYRSELQNLIGMFVATLPYRIEVDSNGSFDQLVQQVREQCFSVIEHSHYPLQNILADLHHLQSTANFLEIAYDFVTLARDDENLECCGSNFQIVSSQQMDDVAKFDWLLTFVHDQSAVHNPISVALICSRDLFDQNTVNTLGARFMLLIQDIFGSNPSFDTRQPLYQLSIILPNEFLVIDQLMYKDKTQKTTADNIVGDLFCQEAEKYAQKIAVALDEQSITYNELLFYVQQLAAQLINEYDVQPGEIICQCMERTLSIVIGLMSIQITGAVYCPLSPQDPQKRLGNLIEQTRTRFILIHSMTNNVFDKSNLTFDIDTIVSADATVSDDDLRRLSQISVTPDSISYVVFTSGSTGTPKAVQVRHRNVTNYTQSIVEIGAFNNNDNVAQMAGCSFDMHIQDIISTLISGGSLIMLHPQGNTDLAYFVDQLMEKEVTFMDSVPSYLGTLSQYLETQRGGQCLEKLRSVCSGGENLTTQIITHLKKYVAPSSSSSPGCQLWNLYGPAEATIGSTYFCIDFDFSEKVIPIGRPLPNYECLILDEFSQKVILGQEGELFIGGVGIFSGYLGRADLTAKMLLEIDNKVFYRTGDLIRYDQHGLLYYISRKDYQVKLRGQRIELSEIERCVFSASAFVKGCTVIKWLDEHLIAYVQCNDIDEGLLRNYCRSHLPHYMVPSKFILMERFPLNVNGKLDRHRLPAPEFSSVTKSHHDDVPLTPLEQQLQDIFSQAFQLKAPNVEAAFGQLGGTSLNAMLALTLIRQQISTKVDISLIFANPSIRQLARAIESSVLIEKSSYTPLTMKQEQETTVHLEPSLLIESVGTIVLICQWLWPIIILGQRCSSLLVTVPLIHLMFYAICSNLLSSKIEKTDNMFSSSYYRWWFLERLWSNNTYWLRYLIGTPFYNYYLRLCGARIGLGTHIYTTIIDAPWLLDIDNGVWIADYTCLNCLSFNVRDIFQLHSIKIGSGCSIGTRSILFDGVDMQENIIAQPMSRITGFIASQTVIDGDEHKSLSSDTFITDCNRPLSIWQKIYQAIALFLLICIHSILLIIFYKMHAFIQLPLPVGIAFCWVLWSISSFSICLILLKFVVGSCSANETYSIASWKYLHKLWLRQLIVSSFYHALLLPASYDYIYPCVLRWLNAHVGDNVKISEIDTFLSFPTNLLKIETGVTTFGSVLMVPTELTMSGYHRVDCITLGTYTNFGNGCSILPGSHLASESMVGNLTRVSRETDYNEGKILIGVPARSMPFSMPPRSDTMDQIEVIPFWHTCLTLCISKCILLWIYLTMGLIGGPIIHTTLVCCFYRWRSYVRNQTLKHVLIKLWRDHQLFICSFLGNSQWLVQVFRAFGAHIGKNVILPDFSCLTDYDLVSIGDNVRFNTYASIQCHSFEQRIHKLANVTIGDGSVLMSGSFVLAGCKLMGNNRLYPYTMVMKNDQLPLNTNWKGVPARYVSENAHTTSSVIVSDNSIEHEQTYEKSDELTMRYEWIASTYANTDDVQFMNCGYADLDQNGDNKTANYSTKLYEQILANLPLKNMSVLELSCGIGNGAAWYASTHAPRSYIGMDRSRAFIDLCKRTHSAIPRLSFIQADATKHLPFENESMDIVFCVEATHAYGGPAVIKNFAAEVARVLRPNGCFLWCDLCDMDGSRASITHLTSNGEFIVEQEINITPNVLHALDIQSKSRANIIERIVRPIEQDDFHQLAGIPGTKIYEDMREGRTQYWRVVLRKKTSS